MLIFNAHQQGKRAISIGSFFGVLLENVPSSNLKTVNPAISALLSVQ